MNSAGATLVLCRRPQFDFSIACISILRLPWIIRQRNNLEPQNPFEADWEQRELRLASQAKIFGARHHSGGHPCIPRHCALPSSVFLVQL
jgi:hypothetical protein